MYNRLSFERCSELVIYFSLIEYDYYLSNVNIYEKH